MKPNECEIKKGMNRTLTYEETLEYLHSMPRTRRQPTLARIKRLMSYLGNPEKQLAGRFIHVTGTNGKGSVCAYTASVLKQAGFRTGRFTSPFINDFSERIEVDGVPIPHAEVAKMGEILKGAAERLYKDTWEWPIEFELVTCMGLMWFAWQKCDYVVLEVGIGGDTDPTNVVEPLISVITQIDYDHTELLGDTLEEIAEKKAGIIKPGAPCVICPPPGASVYKVIQDRCDAVGAPLYVTRDDEIRMHEMRPGFLSFKYDGRIYRTVMSGLYQPHNAICAIEVLHVMANMGIRITERAICRGMLNTRFPARFEVLSEDPLIILDGAHNANGLGALGRNLRHYFPDRPILVLCGMLADKNPEAALGALYDVTEIPERYIPPKPILAGDAALADSSDVVAEAPSDGVSAKKRVRKWVSRPGARSYVFHKHPDTLGVDGEIRIAYAACITPPSPRALPGTQLAELYRGRGIEADAYPDVETAIAALRARAAAEGEEKPPIICFGSLYFSGQVRTAAKG